MTAAPRTSKEGPGMTLRTKAAAVALAAGLLMAPMAAIVTPAASYGAPDEAVTRAADWLGQQFTDGQYLIGFDGVTPDPTYTIDGTLAAAPDKPKPAPAATPPAADKKPEKRLFFR